MATWVIPVSVSQSDSASRSTVMVPNALYHDGSLFHARIRGLTLSTCPVSHVNPCEIEEWRPI
jgi:hypothetical protein